MYKSFFSKLAEKENGRLQFQDKDISVGLGVSSPSVIYKVTFDYKGNQFEIGNRTGTALLV
jgi:hypothetical protein